MPTARQFTLHPTVAAPTTAKTAPSQTKRNRRRVWNAFPTRPFRKARENRDWCCARRSTPLATGMSRGRITECKLVLLGDSNVGKSCLVHRFVKHQFNSDQVTTVGAAFLQSPVPLDDSDDKIQFGIWDTAGSERYKALAPMYYRGAEAAIVVYDITRCARTLHNSVMNQNRNPICSRVTRLTSARSVAPQLRVFRGCKKLGARAQTLRPTERGRCTRGEQAGSGAVPSRLDSRGAGVCARERADVLRDVRQDGVQREKNVCGAGCVLPSLSFLLSLALNAYSRELLSLLACALSLRHSRRRSPTSATEGRQRDVQLDESRQCTAQGWWLRLLSPI